MIQGGLFDLDSKIKRLEELEREMSDINFWNDKDNANKVIGEVNELKSVIEPILDLEKSISNNLEMLEIIDNDDDMIGVIEDEEEQDE